MWHKHTRTIYFTYIPGYGFKRSYMEYSKYSPSFKFTRTGVRYVSNSGSVESKNGSVESKNGSVGSQNGSERSDDGSVGSQNGSEISDNGYATDSERSYYEQGIHAIPNAPVTDIPETELKNYIKKVRNFVLHPE